MCDPNKKNSTHGGYLEGKIRIDGYKDEDLYMRLSCVADIALSKRILERTQGMILGEYIGDVANLSPLLLHNLRFEKAENSHKKVRRNELELPIRRERPFLLYKISKGQVYDANNSLITTMENGCIDLGHHYKQMNIVALTPNKRSNSTGITVSDVLEEKLKIIDMKNWKWNHDKIIMFHDNSSGIGASATKRKRKVDTVDECIDVEEIKFFRVCVETFRDERYTNRFAMADISKEIRNSATMIGIVFFEPQKSELQGGVPILVSCQGKSCKDVIPCFVVCDAFDRIQKMETENLNQPDVRKIQRHANTLKFETPPQRCCVVKHIRERNLFIKFLVKKESESSYMLNFRYLLSWEDHPEVQGTCQDCTLMTDLRSAFSSDENIESDCIQGHGHDKDRQGELESVEMTPNEQEAEEISIEEEEEKGDLIPIGPRSGWEKIKLIPLVTWFIRMLSFEITKA